MNLFQKKVIDFLKIDENKLAFYLKEYSMDDLESPNNFLHITKASKRILEAVENNEKVMVYGDYDCDGICATSIIVKMFQYLNMKVGFYIPSRYIDGYGINLSRAKQIVEKGYKWVITVDNGVAAHEALKYLSDNNVDVILTDHHEITTDLPPCYVALHPDLKENGDNLRQCGAYVAFMLSREVLGRTDEYLLTLAGVATISDMMPLIEYNRIITKLTLKIISEHKEFPYHQLVQPKTIIDEEVLSFGICPKINAFGRIKEDLSVNDMVRFFVSEDYFERMEIAHEINVTNSSRKDKLNNTLSLLDYSKYDSQKIIIAKFDDVSEGIIGLIAARILNECNKPCIVLTTTKEGVLKGSARSIKGLSIIELLIYCKDVLLTYGGHQEAGGLSLENDNYDKFVKLVENYSQNIEITPLQEVSIKISKDDLSYDNYLFLKQLSPFGVGFETPKFELEIEKKSLSFIGNNLNHIRSQLTPNATLIGFNLADQIIDDEIIAIGTIHEDTYKKGKCISFKVGSIKNKVMN